MKKILSILLVMAMLLSVAPAVYAEADEYENNMPREERQARFEKLRAKKLEERAYQLSKAEERAVKATGEDEAELFAAPIAFKENVTITLPLQESVRLEFKTPFTEWPDLYGYLVDEDGNEVEDSWVSGSVNGEYDEDTYEFLCSYFDVEYIDEWNLEKGEYKLYLEDWYTGKVYGPATVLNPGYEINGVLQTGKISRLSYYFRNPMKGTPESVDFKLVNQSGKAVYELEGVGIEWSYEAGFDFSLFVASSVADGVYKAETTVYYTDGTKEKLIPTSVMAGNYAYVENIRALNRTFDNNTDEIYVEVYFKEMPIDMSEYEVQLVTWQGEVGARSKNYAIEDIWSDGVQVLYTVDASNLTADEYEVVIDYSGDKTFYCQYNDTVIRKSSDRHYWPSVERTKKISDKEYIALTSGFDAGVYTVYSDYSCSVAIGKITVGADGMGTILFNESFSGRNIYVKHEEDGIYIYLEDYTSVDVDTSISSVTPGFIGSGAKSITGFKFTIEDFAYITEDEIGDVTLIYDGAVVAKGENVEESDRGFLRTGTAFYARTTFEVDFSITKTLSAGKKVTLKVETAYGDVEYEIPVVSGTDSAYSGYSVGIHNGCYMGEDMIYFDPDDPNNYEYCSQSVGEDVEFGVSNINRTSFTATLYKYNAKTYEFDKSKALKSSSMTKGTVAGYAYYYTGKFSSLDEGYYMIDVDGKKTDIFKVVTEPVIYTHGNYVEYLGDNYSYYFDTLNVSSSASIKAYYYNASGKKKDVSVDKECYDGYAYLGFDLSGVSFDNLTLYITVGSKVAATVQLYNMEGCEQLGWVNYEYREDMLLIGFDDKSVLKNPTLVVKGYSEVALTKVYGETVLEKKVNFGTSNYVELSISSLDLPDGSYVAYVTDGDRIVSWSDMFSVREPKTVAKADVTIESVTTTSSRVTAKIKNNTSSTLKNIYLVVAGYNEDGIVVGVKTKKVASVSSNATQSPYVDAIKGAETYEVYVWDGVSSMKPLSK